MTKTFLGHLNLITEEIKTTIKARDDAIKKNEPLRNEISNKDKQLMKSSPHWRLSRKDEIKTVSNISR